MVGTHSGDMIGEIALAIELGLDAVDIGISFQPHPTLGESIGMAAKVAHGSCADVPPERKKPEAAVLDQNSAAYLSNVPKVIRTKIGDFHIPGFHALGKSFSSSRCNPIQAWSKLSFLDKGVPGSTTRQKGGKSASGTFLSLCSSHANSATIRKKMEVDTGHVASQACAWAIR